MKYFLISLLVIISFVFSYKVFGLDDNSNIISEKPDMKLHQFCLYPTVKLLDKTGVGSGVIVRSTKVDDKYYNVVITCAHVVNGQETMTVKFANYEDCSTFKDYTDYKSIVYEKEDDRDLAVLIFLSNKKMPTAEFGFEEKLYIGSNIFHIGCGLGGQPRLDDGKITLVNKDMYRTSMFAIFGDSGGPTFHNYKLVGITNAIKMYKRDGNSVPVYNISYTVPINQLKSWNSEINNKLSFSYDMNEKLPMLPFYFIQMEEWEETKE